MSTEDDLDPGNWHAACNELIAGLERDKDDLMKVLNAARTFCHLVEADQNGGAGDYYWHSSVRRAHVELNNMIARFDSETSHDK